MAAVTGMQAALEELGRPMLAGAAPQAQLGTPMDAEVGKSVPLEEPGRPKEAVAGTRIRALVGTRMEEPEEMRAAAHPEARVDRPEAH
jgi:hypothetical protein